PARAATLADYFPLDTGDTWDYEEVGTGKATHVEVGRQVAAFLPAFRVTEDGTPTIIEKAGSGVVISATGGLLYELGAASGTKFTGRDGGLWFVAARREV